MSYSNFAAFYDKLQSDVDYAARANVLLNLFKKYDRLPTLLLDMACGTGGFSEQFLKEGIDVIGVDPSYEMLSVAMDKLSGGNNPPLLLCQKAAELDLYGTVDGAVCCLDSINHITDEKELLKSLKRISLFLEKGRLFIFDVNTLYKHKEVLSGNTFEANAQDINCVWNNSECDENGVVEISLEFYKKTDNGNEYICSEQFSERAYSNETLSKMLKKAGLEVLARLGENGENEPQKTEQRIIYVTRKI